jgi:hypothetical protein
LSVFRADWWDDDLAADYLFLGGRDGLETPSTATGHVPVATGQVPLTPGNKHGGEQHHGKHADQ